MVEPIERPRFYDLETADGVKYEQLARLHGADVLATTVVQTCIRYTHESTRCRFCTIEESLRAGATTQVKRPEQLAEVAEAAVRLDGVRADGDDDRHLQRPRPRRQAPRRAACGRSRRAVPDLPIQVQIEPPLDLEWIDALAPGGRGGDRHPHRVAGPRGARPLDAGQGHRPALALLGGLGARRGRLRPQPRLHLPARRPRRGPGRARRRREAPDRPWACTRSSCPTARCVGSLAHARRRPRARPGHAAERHAPRRRGALAAAGMRGADQGAGCAACGACSALQSGGRMSDCSSAGRSGARR